MNFFVISDIHGSLTAIKRAIELYEKGNFDKILLCGDILYHGARNPLPEGYNPKEVLSILNEYKYEIIAIRGNCESEVDAMVLEFPITADYSYVINKDRDIFLTHGHVYSKENLPPLKSGSIFLSGHTHIPLAEKYNSIYILNPGSVSLPKGGYNPSFGVLNSEGWDVKDLITEKTILSCSFT